MRAFCVLLGGLALAASAASAETCKEQVASFAEAHGLEASPPAVENMGTTAPAPPATLESRGLGAEPLVKSGGVAEPVAESAKEAAGMPSDDKVGAGETSATDAPERVPPAEASEVETDRKLRAENLLLGAMSAADKGREKECLTLLQEAKEAI